MFETLQSEQKVLFYLEKRLKVFFAIMFMAVLPFVTYYLEGILSIGNRDILVTSMKFTFFFLQIIINVSFWWLLYLMRSYHRYEYDRNKTWLLIFYVALMVIVWLDFFVLKYNYDQETETFTGLQGLY